MKTLLYISCLLIIEIYSILPAWNLVALSIDTLEISNPYTYLIDHRDWIYGSSDELTKTIKKETNGNITHSNIFKIYEYHWSNLLYNGTVDFEAVESFYNSGDHTKNKISSLIICPRGNYNPLKITYTSSYSELPFLSDWIKTDKFDLKCYFHRSQDGHFLVHYLMNKENYLLELDSSDILNTIEQYRLDVEEMYDFKLLNRESEYYNDHAYPFIGLAKKIGYLCLIGTKINFYTPGSQTITNLREIIPIKNHTQAYFHVYHFDNSFYYFTYNDIHDFVSGYSTNSIANVAYPSYVEIDGVVWVNNEVSPFEFLDEVEIIKMENIFNYRYIYYIIKNKVTNILYHGLVDIILNKVVFNTDTEVKLYIPYIYYKKVDENTGYEHSDSMLLITNETAYRVCVVKNSIGDGCEDSCSSGQKLLLDTEGNKCVSESIT